MDNELMLMDGNQPRNSFLHDEEHSNNSAELKKKRKLQCILENATLPLLKYKFQNRGNLENTKGSLKELAFRVIRDGSIEEFGDSTDSENEGYDTTMTLDLNDDEGETSGESFPKYLPSTSSSSTRVGDDLEDVFQTEKMCEGDNEGCEGYNFSEILETGDGHIDGGIESMLYANGVPRMFLDSSGDNLVRPKKPTIDQEFEQYFSTLML